MVEKKHMSFSLENLMKQVSEQRYPPVEKWNPEFCGTIDMCIKADGTWFYMGTPITRKRMVKLFSSVLRKDADGETYLVTPVEKIGITVEDAHFTVISVDGLGDEEQQLVFTTNMDDKIALGPENKMWVIVDDKTQEPRPYINVRGNLTGLISRAVFYELVNNAEEKTKGDKTELVIKSGGVEFSLGEWSSN